MFEKARGVSIEQLEVEINQLFTRLRDGALTSGDLINASEVNSQVHPSHADSWFQSGSVMEPDILPFRFVDNPNTTILDVGAHTGYTAVSLRHTPVQNFIHSVEPMAVYNPTLDRIAQLDPRYSYSNVAASDRFGTVYAYNLVINGVLVGGTTSIAGVTFQDWFSSYILTRIEELLPGAVIFVPQLLRVHFKTIPLDTLITQDFQWRRQGTHISGLKIDVEGHEFSAVSGATKILLEHKPLVMIETSEIALMIERMAESFYKPFERVGEHLRPKQKNHYNVYFVHDAMQLYYRAIGLITA